MRKRVRPWVYIIGPYTGKTVTEQASNCGFALNMAGRVWEAGGAAFCPHMNSYMLDDFASHSGFVGAYKKIMCACDGVVLLNGWRGSRGSSEEWGMAKKKGMPAYHDFDSEGKTLDEWISDLKIRWYF